MFGYAPDEFVGQHVSLQNAYPPEENKKRVEAVIAELQASGSWDGEWRNRRKDETEFITTSRSSAVEIEGRLHWLCVQRDITQAKKAQEHQRLLINELNQRVKNTLATVQSIASQTLRNAETAEEARAALESRLLALSRAHDVLTRENWEGADLFEIVADAVEPYSNSGEDRLHLSGETIRLPPRMALALAMAVQELATNAVKYGALFPRTTSKGNRLNRLVLVRVKERSTRTSAHVRAGRIQPRPGRRQGSPHAGFQARTAKHG